MFFLKLHDECGFSKIFHLWFSLWFCSENTKWCFKELVSFSEACLAIVSQNCTKNKEWHCKCGQNWDHAAINFTISNWQTNILLTNWNSFCFDSLKLKHGRKWIFCEKHFCLWKFWIAEHQMHVREFCENLLHHDQWVDSIKEMAKKKQIDWLLHFQNCNNVNATKSRTRTTT